MKNKLKCYKTKYYSLATNNYTAFSFVELIVGITISMMLMLSVSLFVQNGIKNLTAQKSTLENDVKMKDFVKNIYENVESYDSTFTPTNLSSGVLLKINKTFDKGGVSYIGTSTLDGYYCESGSENPLTNHIVIKSFIPFEGQGADIFTGNNFNFGGINTNQFSGTINNTKIQDIIGPTDIAFGIGNIGYLSDTLGHSIYEFDKTNIPGTIKKIAGSAVFGDEFLDGSSGTGVYLNSPTGLSFSTIGAKSYLFVSDTLNDRILYIDLSNYKIYKLIGRDEGLKEPTGIYYNDNEKTLYIANSGKKEILSYSSSGSFVNSASLSFTPESNINNVNKLEFSFLFASGTTNPLLTSPTSTGDINLPPSIKNEDFLKGSTNKLTYYLVNYNGSTIAETNCISSPSYVIGTSGDPIYCSQVGTGITSTYQNKNLISGTNYQITINNIGPSVNFNNTGAYYVKLSLLSGITNLKNYYIPYFSKGDQDIFTKTDNILKTITGSLGYPTGIYQNGNNLIFNDFLQRKKIEITKTGTIVGTPIYLSPVNFSNIPRNRYTDVTLYTPVKNYDINTSNNLLSIFINYYKNYSCYGDESINQTKEFILKKNLN